MQGSAISMKTTTGLTEAQVIESRQKYGANTLTKQKRKSFIKQFAASFGDPIIKILLAALAVNVLFLFQKADWFETAGIAVAIFLATFISTLSEYGSESAFIELQNSASNIYCRVKRASGITKLPVSELVVGDLVLLRAGERVPADGVIVSGRLGVDQSALNGESADAEKLPVSSKQPENDLSSQNQLFCGSVVTYGEGILEIKRVGDSTLYGSMARDIQEEAPDSPLKLKLAGLAATISRIGYAAAVLIAAADLFNSFFLDNGMSLSNAISDLSSPGIWLPRLLHALTLATAVIVMAVPEGLPMMITVVLSSNMFRMLKDKVMVRGLIGIETSGNINILFTDKTGTLTKGKLKVVNVVEGDGSIKTAPEKCSGEVRRLLALDGKYNTACVIADGKPSGGSATDRAVIESVIGLKTDRYTKHGSIPFDSKYKYSAVRIIGNDELILVSGAPEKIIAACNRRITENGGTAPLDKSLIEKKRAELSAKAIRLIAVASAETLPDPAAPLSGLTLVALLGIRDDIRREVPAAIREVTRAGIQVVMMTGDSRDTAAAIAKDIGLSNGEGIITSNELSKLSDEEIKKRLPSLRVIARALPSDKSRMVRLAQSLGMVVGMTGDGINDAPALKRADVGFAMGDGTEVAKEAGDIVIMDNNFASIAKAVRYGRTIFKSIRKFIVYQFTMNMCAVAVSLIGPFVGIDTPVTVIQMLWINIIMDTLAGLAFAGEAPLAECMKEKPLGRNTPVIDRKMAKQIFFMGLYTTALLVFFMTNRGFRDYFGFESDPIYFLTAFYALFIFAGVFNSFNARCERVNILSHLKDNPVFIIIMLTVVAVQLVMTYCGGRIFRTAGLDPKALIMIILMAFTVIPADQLRKAISEKIK